MLKKNVTIQKESKKESTTYASIYILSTKKKIWHYYYTQQIMIGPLPGGATYWTPLTQTETSPP